MDREPRFVGLFDLEAGAILEDCTEAESIPLTEVTMDDWELHFQEKSHRRASRQSRKAVGNVVVLAVIGSIIMAVAIGGLDIVAAAASNAIDSVQAQHFGK
jgi:hypothetical protein